MLNINSKSSPDRFKNIFRNALTTMNLSDNPNSSAKITHQSHPSSINHSEAPIEAEIIAESRINQNQTEAVDETTINLVYQPSSFEADQFSFEEDPDHSLPLWLKQALMPFTSPWGLASLSLILASNLGICGVQLWKAQTIKTAETKATENPTETLSKLPTPNPEKASSDSIKLDALSIVSTKAVPKSPSPKNLDSGSKPQPVAANVVNVNQPLSLTNAILPPSLQPQVPANYGTSSTTIPVPPRPTTILLPPPPPLNTFQPPAVQPVAIQPPPPPSSTIEVSKDEQIRQQIKQQLHREESNNIETPLGFNHKTRLELQNGLNQVPSELLPRQVNQLEQLQQRQALDSVK
ncbi:hypothetical protein [Crocosphaera sp. XPORK-15E]|uniref:hypothetical protein n=1 Tax=Crocosphaera sp. XPORK-15E TaxID=3110247 RepID=UPI002B1F6B64|nr:hypothetical protein [Crocosphaera sp. XPORK-15E]MEA5535926.1 hypothetical protein [Crocosphaera sp. XPORK-15E]